jgi:hypothetical protein
MSQAVGLTAPSRLLVQSMKLNQMQCFILQSHVTQLISRSTWTLIMIHWTVSPMSIHLRSMKGEQARHTVSYVQYQCSPFHVKEDSEILTDGK